MLHQQGLYARLCGPVLLGACRQGVPWHPHTPISGWRVELAGQVKLPVKCWFDHYGAYGRHSCVTHDSAMFVDSCPHLCLAGMPPTGQAGWRCLCPVHRTYPVLHPRVVHDRSHRKSIG